VLRWKDRRHVLHLHRDRAVLSRQDKACNEIAAECLVNEGNPILAIESCMQQLAQESALLEIVFDDSYARFWQVTPPLHAARLPDLQTAAAMRLEALFGLPAADWIIEADWHATRPFWACALPAALVSRVEQALRSGPTKINITACYPYFIQQWNQHAGALGKQTAAFAVVGDRAMTLALIGEGTIKSIRPLAIDPLDTETLHTAANAIHSLSLQLGIDAPQEVLLAGRLGPYREEVIAGKICWRQACPRKPAPAHAAPALEKAA
jgi:hypothetical protein